LEDVLVDEPARWRFIQVKTRDAGAAWLFGDFSMTAARCIASCARITLAGFVEGRELRYVMSSSLHLRRFRSDPVIIAAGSPALKATRAG
jgi:hypothetical protein